MLDIKTIIDQLAFGLFTSDPTQVKGRNMYKKYCSNCYKIFNIFDLLDKYHDVMRDRKELILYYTMAPVILKKYISIFEQNTSCGCDTGEEVVASVNEDGHVVQYSIWSHPLFLHYDYLVLDPTTLLHLQGPEDENIVQLVQEKLRMREIDALTRDIWSYDDPPAFNFHDQEQDQDDSLITYEEANIEQPTFVVDGDDIRTPEQPITRNDTQAHIRPTFTIPDRETLDNIARRLNFDDYEPVDVSNDIRFRPMTDIDLWMLQHVHENMFDTPVDHPILTRLLRQGHKELPTIQNDTNIYDSEYRINYRLSQKNFLIKTYTEDTLWGAPTLRVQRDIPALINEIKLWIEYFEKPHNSVVNTTILSLRNNINTDCIYNIVKFI